MMKKKLSPLVDLTPRILHYILQCTTFSSELYIITNSTEDDYERNYVL